MRGQAESHSVHKRLALLSQHRGILITPGGAHLWPRGTSKGVTVVAPRPSPSGRELRDDGGPPNGIEARVGAR